VTPQVFQFIGPSNDGRRHGRGTYLLCIDHGVTNYCPITFTSSWAIFSGVVEYANDLNPCLTRDGDGKRHSKDNCNDDLIVVLWLQ
jgi:hypothetical protein